jgi:hypothetical protein
MPERDLVKTGIAGLDEILSDGIPRGNVILVEGAIGGCGLRLGNVAVGSDTATGALPLKSADRDRSLPGGRISSGVWRTRFQHKPRSHNVT